MRDYLQNIYKEKYTYYYKILMLLDDDRILYTLMNFNNADDNPGDLDILINKNDYNNICEILKSEKYYYYYNIYQGQYLWCKYVKDIGFIQFHIYTKICYFEKSINVTFSNRENTFSVEDDYILFLIESYFKNKYTQKISTYYKYLGIIDVNTIHALLNSTYDPYCQIIDQSIKQFEKGMNYSKFKYIINIFKWNYIGLIKFLMFRAGQRVRRIMKEKDIVVSILGVDGSGKSTLADNIYKISSKGGLHTEVRYAGIRNSLLSKIKRMLIPEDEQRIRSSTLFSEDSEDIRLNNIGKKHNYKQMQLKHIIALIIYWLEFNLRWLLFFKINKNSAKTLHILDRSYIDIFISRGKEKFNKLFIKYSFKPDLLVILNGDLSTFMHRKNCEHNMQYLNSFMQLYNKNKKYYTECGTAIKDIDMVNNSELQAAHDVVHEVMKLYSGS